MEASWQKLAQDISECSRCGLCETCIQKVPGQGDLSAPLMLIGEGPGAQEDERGLAFVGPAGQLLTRMLAAIGLPRERVYICNTVKCRPPHNRVPTEDERAACLRHLRAQVTLVQPRVIVLLGSTAVRDVLGDTWRITRCHGQWFERAGVAISATYHPSALLRDESKKRDAWEDLKKVRAKLVELGLYADLLKEESNHADMGTVEP
ncbi:MAG: uracil-DNA glycosylase [Eubacteriales bacterium]|nr:uracil-DNA glycosylase [Eubacteriales bacterium]